MPFSYEHAFRYETSLCSLAEDETLGRTRTAVAEPSERRFGLRDRLGLRRALGRWRAGR
jgi:hypothetical protein